MCLFGCNLLPADPCYTLLAFANNARRGAIHAQPLLSIACTALRQHLHTTMPCTALDGHSYIHSNSKDRATCTATRWTELHVQQLDGENYTVRHRIDRATCTATRWTALHVQHCMRSTVSRTALFAQNYIMTAAAQHLDSTACTALHWCWCTMCSEATLRAVVHLLVCHQRYTGVFVCMPACGVLLSDQWYANQSLTDRQTDQHRRRSPVSHFYYHHC